MLLDHHTRQFVLHLLDEVPDLTLATIRPDGYPQATTVSYAHDGLTLYVGVGLGSQKACNIQGNNRVSLAITKPYADWQHIQGLSMAATARIIDDLEETQHASECMLRRFPHIRDMMQGTNALPWAGAVFLRITPSVISVLDYEQGFGHTTLYDVA
ncbi:pyridoxamine 5'-phosphate oxidase family protein [Janthinobacterium sp. PSPC2-1]|uniref:pyridoxamine 5'-phosphate oxidase family protein n=1 Tax=unclassified Janthinobacterium TaxID=2610881 RepID=UPI003CF7B2AC